MDNPQPVDFIRWIVLLPLIGAAINFFLGATFQKKFGRRAVSIIGCGVVIASFVLGLRVFFQMRTGSATAITVARTISARPSRCGELIPNST